jgi:GDP-mannose 6-dehydrogenase
VKAAARHLGEAVRQRSPELSPMLLVFRSTMLPGSMNEIVLPAIASAAGEPPGARYDVAYNPEFTREGSAVADYLAPARIVIGERRPGSARLLVNLFGDIKAPIFTTSFEVAELTKFADNTFHALKVTFANEIGRFALQSGVSPGEFFDIFQADTKLNLSAAYLRPGGAFGGSCLPKDVRALAARMNDIGIAAPVIDHILESNSLHTDFLVAEIERRTTPRSRILLVGLSFKTGSDDVRESPLVRVAESLLALGYDLSIYDPDLACDGVVGTHTELPSRLSAAILSQLPEEVAWDLVVVGKKLPSILQTLGASCSLFHIDWL